MKFLLSIALFIGLNPLLWANDLPPRVEIKYKIITELGEGELNEVFEIFQDSQSFRYSITSNARPVGVLKLIKPGSIVRDSQGVITDTGLVPQQFTDQRNEDPPSIAKFDWENNLLMLRHKDEKKQEPLPAGTQDRLSLPYSFIFATPLKQKKIKMYETDGRTLNVADYTVNKEVLETPLGQLDTIVLTRQPTIDDKIDRKMWLAIAHHMLPVRIIAREESGLKLEQIVTKINYTNKTANDLMADQLTENRQ